RIGPPGSDSLADHLLRLRDEFRIERLGNLIESVPVGVVRSLHRSTMTGPATLMMPNLVPGPLDLGRKRVVSDQTVLLQCRKDCRPRLAEFVVVEFHQPIVLRVEAACN